MKMTLQTVVLGGLATVFMFMNQVAWGQNLGFIARNACQIHEEAEDLSDLIHEDLHSSPFEHRLMNDAAEIARTAARIELVAERSGNVRQMQGDARLLSIVLQRMDRTLHEAERFAEREAFGKHCRRPIQIALVDNKIQHIARHVENLERDLEVACRWNDSQPHWHSQSYSSNWREPHSFRSSGYDPRIITPNGNVLSFQNGRISIQYGR